MSGRNRIDLISGLGPLAFARRLRRLGERLHRDGSQIYQELAFDFQARWFPLLYLLSKESPLAVTEIAEALRLTHPAVNQIAGVMSARGLLKSTRDSDDERRRLLALTDKGKKLVASLRPVWREIETATEELLQKTDPGLLKTLGKIEAELDRCSMRDRVLGRIKRKEKLEIISFRPEYRRYFRDLNCQWLEEHFSVEPEDEVILSNPESQVIDKGGEVFFARCNGKIVGTAALLKRDDSAFELVKMAVAPEARRRGIGRRLTETAMEHAAKRGATRLLLLTSPELTAAVALYRKLGFREVRLSKHVKGTYARCGIAMQIELKGDKGRVTGR